MTEWQKMSPRTAIIISQTYAPDIIGVAKYTSELAEGLVEREWSVKVICPPPFYPEWKVRKGYSAKEFHVETINGVEVFRSPTYVPSNPSGIRRIAHVSSFAVTSAIILANQFSKERPHLVITVVPTLAAAILPAIFCRILGVKSLIHVQDFEVEAAFDLGILKSNIAYFLALKFETMIFGLYDFCSSITPKMIKKLIEKGVDENHVISLRNWADIAAIQPIESATAYRNDLEIAENQIVVMYSGNMAGKQGLEIIVEAAKILDKSRTDITFIISGDGPIKEHLIYSAQGLSNVHFIPLQPKSRLGELLGTANIHLLPQKKEVADLVLPSKLSGMLASGRPVICCAEQGTGLAAEIGNAGIVISPGDQVAMANAIITLADDPERRLNMGNHARNLGEANWSQEKILDEFDVKLRGIVEKR